MCTKQYKQHWQYDTWNYDTTWGKIRMMGTLIRKECPLRPPPPKARYQNTFNTKSWDSFPHTQHHCLTIHTHTHTHTSQASMWSWIYIYIWKVKRKKVWLAADAQTEKDFKSVFIVCFWSVVLRLMLNWDCIWAWCTEQVNSKWWGNGGRKHTALLSFWNLKVC